MVSIGLSRLPPESIKWCASVGMSSTSETAFSRMMRLTTPISSSTSARIGDKLVAGSRGSSSGTTTPTAFSSGRVCVGATTCSWYMYPALCGLPRHINASMLRRAGFDHNAGNLALQQPCPAFWTRQASAPGLMAMTPPDSKFGLRLSEDAFLGGAVTALQPVGGDRAGLDAVLLAAAGSAPAAASERVLDVGAGVGVVGMCIAARVDNAHVTLLEIEPSLARIARENVARNGLEGRLDVIAADIGATARSHAALG